MASRVAVLTIAVQGDFLGGGVIENDTHGDTLDPGDENGIDGFQLDYSEYLLPGSQSGEGTVASFQLVALELPDGVDEITTTISFDTDYENNRETGGTLSPCGSFFYPTFTEPAATITIVRRIRGDVSGNGKVTAYDASLVLRHVVCLTTLLPEPQKNADVTGDGTSTALAAAMLLP